MSALADWILPLTSPVCGNNPWFPERTVVSTRIQPFNNFVIVKLDPADEKVGGLYIHPNYRFPKKTGTVRAVGRGLVTASGAIVPPQAQVGDRVFVMDTGNLKEIEHDGEACVILPDESMLLGKILGEPVETALAGL